MFVSGKRLRCFTKLKSSDVVDISDSTAITSYFKTSGIEDTLISLLTNECDPVDMLPAHEHLLMRISTPDFSTMSDDHRAHFFKSTQGRIALLAEAVRVPTRSYGFDRTLVALV
jgi:hypothetical protein